MRLLSLSLLAAVLAAGCTQDLSGFELPGPEQALPPHPTTGTLEGRLVMPEGSAFTAAGRSVALESADAEAALVATTDDDGRFRYLDLKPGDYALRVSIGGLAPLRVDVRGLLAGEDRKLGDLRLDALALEDKSAATLLGKVIVQNDAASPTGALVEFVLEPSRPGEVATRVALAPVGGDGLFSQLLAPGKYTVRANHPDLGQTAAVTVELKASEKRDLTASPLVFVIDPATITGSVTREVDLDAPVAAAAASVQLDDRSPVATDVAGKFELTAIPAGTHQLRVTLAGYSDPTAAHTVELKAGQKLDFGTVALALDRGTVKGEVVLDDGKPVEGVTLSLPKGYATVAAVQPDGRGVFRIERVPAGTYLLSAQKDRYAVGTANVVVTKNGVTDVGTLKLAQTAGDFGIDDNDPDSIAGYTRSTDVWLQLTLPQSVKCYRVSESKSDFAPASSAGDAGVDGGTTALTCNPIAIGSPAPKYTLATSAEGTHDVYVEFENLDGSRSPVLHSAVVYDKSGPDPVTLKVENDAPFTRDSAAFDLSLAATDSSGLNGMRLNFDGKLANTPGGPFTCATFPANVPAGEVLDAPKVRYERDFSKARVNAVDGRASVFAQVFDNAGNGSRIVCKEITVDTVAPTSTGLTIGRNPLAVDGTLTNSPIVELALTADAEPLSGSVFVKLANRASDLSNAVYQPFAPAMSWFLADPSTDGAKEVYAQFRDSAGNETTPARATIKLDRTPPTASVTLPNGALTRLASVNLDVTANDTNGLQALTLSEDASFGGAVPTTPFPSGTQSFGLSTGDGPHRVYARITDNAGNERVVSAALTLDTTAPVGVLRLGDGSGYARALPLTAAIGAASADLAKVAFLAPTETCATVAASAFVAATNASATVPLPGTQADGAVDVRVCLMDVAGNVSPAPLTGTAVLDRAAPTGTIVLPGTSASAVVTVTLAVSDATSGPYEMEVTESATFSGRFVAYSPVFPLQLSSGEGPKTLRAQVKDRAGNVGTLTQATVQFDPTPPSGTVTVQVGGKAATITNTRAVTLAISASPDTVDMALGSGALDCGAPPGGYVAFNAAPAYTLPSGDGVKTLVVCLRDSAGNVSASTASIELDQTPPTGTMSLNGGQAFTRSQSANAVFTASSDVAEQYVAQATGAATTLTDCTALPTGATFSAFTPVTPLAQLTADGTVNVSACLRDRAGNVSLAPLTGSFVKDATAPALTLTVNDTNPTVTATRTVKLGMAYSDATTRVVSMAFGDDAVDVATAPLEQPTGQRLWSLSAGDGPKTLKVRVYDEAGNVQERTAAITLDTAAPAIAVTATSQTGKTVVAAGEARSLKLAFSLPTSEPTSTTFAFAVSGNGAVDCSTLTFGAMQTAATFPGTGDPALVDNTTYTVTACAKDLAGNVGRALATILVDQVAPNGSFTLGDGSGYAALQAVPVTIVATASDVTRVAFGVGISCATATYEALSAPHSVSISTAGANTVTGCFQDAAGNTGSSTKSITLDPTAPTGTASVASARTSSRRIDVTLNVTEQTPWQAELTTATAFTGNYGATVFTAGQTPTVQFDLPATDADYTLRIRVRDAAGNVTTLAPVAVTLDTTPPAGSLTLTANGVTSPSVTNASTVTVSAASADAVSVTLAAGSDCTTGTTVALPMTTPVSFTLSATNETKTFSGCFRDATGNVFKTSVSTVLDTVAPTANVVIGNGSGFSSTALPTVTLSNVAPDLAFTKIGIGAVCSTTTGYAAYTGSGLSASLTGGNGPKTVITCLEDAAGNVSSVSTDVTLDATAPAGTASLSASVTNDRRVYVSLAVTEQTPWQVELSTSGTFTGSYLPTVYAATQSPTVALDLPDADASYTVTARVLDSAGNVTTLTGVAVTLDRVAPSGTVVINGGAARTNASSVSVVVTGASGQGATSYVLAEGSDCTTGTSKALPQATADTVTFATTTNETKLVSACFKDAAGNIGKVTATIVLDTAAPTASVTIGDGSGYSPTATPTVILSNVAADLAFTKMAIGAVCSDPAGYAAYPSTLSVTLSGGNGAKTVVTCLKDAAGNVGSVSTAVTLDATAPAGTASLASAVTNTRRIDVTLTVTEQSPWQVELSATGTFTGVYAPTTYTATQNPTVQLDLPDADASYTVTARVRDSAGNVTTLTGVPVTLDRVAPTGTVVINGGASLTSSATVSVVVAGASGQGATTYALAEGTDCANATAKALPQGTADSVTFATTTNETKSVSACFRDAAGNVGKVTASIVLDTSAPTATLTIGNGSGYSTSATPSVTLAQASADLASVKFAVGGVCSDTAGYSTYAATGTYSVTLSGVDGPKTVVTCLKDTAGNVTSGSQTVVLDTVDPAGTVSIASPTNSAVVTVTLALTEATSGPVEIELSNTGTFTGNYLPGTFSPPTASVSWTLASGDGTKTVSARARDRAGRVGTLTAGTTTLDTTPPQGSVAIRVGSTIAPQYTNASTVDLVLSLSSDVSQVVAKNGSVTCNSATTGFAAPPTASPPVLTGFALDTTSQGYKVVTLCLKDSAGNVASAATGVIYDSSAPTGEAVSIIGSTVGYTRSYSVFLSLSAAGATEVLVGNAASAGCPTTTVWQPFQQTLAWQLDSTLPDGPSAVYVQYRDAAGNLSACTTATIQVDTTLPGSIRLSSRDGAVNTQSFGVALAAAVQEANFSHYEIMWDGSTTCPTFPNTQTVMKGIATGCALNDCFCKTQSIAALPITLAKNVPNTIRIRAVDLAGNIGTDSTLIMTEDETLPTAPVLGSVQTPVNADFVTVPLDTAATDDITSIRGYEICACTVAGPGVVCDQSVPKTFTCPSANYVPIPGSNSFRIGLAPDQTNYLFVRGVDQANNKGAAASTIVVEDSIGPTAPAITPRDRWLTAPSVFADLGTPATDPNGVVGYQIIGGPYLEWTDISIPTVTTEFIELPLLRDQTNGFQLRAIDAAGNAGTPSNTVSVTEVSTTVLGSSSGVNIAADASPEAWGHLVAYRNANHELQLCDLLYSNCTGPSSAYLAWNLNSSSSRPTGLTGAYSWNGRRLIYVQNGQAIASIDPTMQPYTSTTDYSGMAGSPPLDQPSEQGTRLAFTQDGDVLTCTLGGTCSGTPLNVTASVAERASWPRLVGDVIFFQTVDPVSNRFNVGTFYAPTSTTGDSLMTAPATLPPFGDRTFEVISTGANTWTVVADAVDVLDSSYFKLLTADYGIVGTTPRRQSADANVLLRTQGTNYGVALTRNRFTYAERRDSSSFASQSLPFDPAKEQTERRTAYSVNDHTHLTQSLNRVVFNSADPVTGATSLAITDLASTRSVSSPNHDVRAFAFAGSKAVYYDSNFLMHLVNFAPGSLGETQVVLPQSMIDVADLSLSSNGLMTFVGRIKTSPNTDVWACLPTDCANTAVTVSAAGSGLDHFSSKIVGNRVVYVRYNATVASPRAGDVFLATVNTATTPYSVTRMQVNTGNLSTVAMVDPDLATDASGNPLVVFASRYFAGGIPADNKVFLYDANGTFCSATSATYGTRTCSLSIVPVGPGASGVTGMNPAISADLAVFARPPNGTGPTSNRAIVSVALGPTTFDNTTGELRDQSATTAYTNLSARFNGESYYADAKLPRIQGQRITWLDNRGDPSGAKYQPFMYDRTEGFYIRLRDAVVNTPVELSGNRAAFLNQPVSHSTLQVWEY